MLKYIVLSIFFMINVCLATSGEFSKKNKRPSPEYPIADYIKSGEKKKRRVATDGHDDLDRSDHSQSTFNGNLRLCKKTISTTECVSPNKTEEVSAIKEILNSFKKSDDIDLSNYGKDLMIDEFYIIEDEEATNYDDVGYSSIWQTFVNNTSKEEKEFIIDLFGN